MTKGAQSRPRRNISRRWRCKADQTRRGKRRKKVWRPSGPKRETSGPNRIFTRVIDAGFRGMGRDASFTVRELTGIGEEGGKGAGINGCRLGVWGRFFSTG